LFFFLNSASSIVLKQYVAESTAFTVVLLFFSAPQADV
jgi:hypothetical protein